VVTDTAGERPARLNSFHEKIGVKFMSVATWVILAIFLLVCIGGGVGGANGIARLEEWKRKR
jgi:hypothetical protein